MSASYPKWLYHPSKEAVVVQDEEAHKALGAGWVESPAEYRKAPPPDVKPSSHHVEHPKSAHPAAEHDESAEKHPKKAK